MVYTHMELFYGLFKPLRRKLNNSHIRLVRYIIFNIVRSKSRSFQNFIHHLGNRFYRKSEHLLPRHGHLSLFIGFFAERCFIIFHTAFKCTVLIVIIFDTACNYTRFGRIVLQYRRTRTVTEQYACSPVFPICYSG